MKIQYTLANLINDLIETSKDGELGFRACAENAGSADLKRLFERRAADCAAAAAELQALVSRHGGVPETGGSAAGAVRRFWIKVRDALVGSSDRAILEGCVRGEDAAIADYRMALNDASLPADVRSLIERQLGGIQRNYEQVKTLRDQARASEAAASPVRDGIIATMGRVTPVHGSLLWDPEAYRTDFGARYGSTGSSYTDYLAAYRYGHEIAHDPRYAEHEWSIAEADVRSGWEQNHPDSPWHYFGDAVRHAWQRSRND